LEPYDDAGFCDEFLRVKRANKERLARISHTGLVFGRR
jgi:hypothetical protein